MVSNPDFQYFLITDHVNILISVILLTMYFCYFTDHVNILISVILLTMYFCYFTDHVNSYPSYFTDHVPLLFYWSCKYILISVILEEKIEEAGKPEPVEELQDMVEQSAEEEVVKYIQPAAQER